MLNTMKIKRPSVIVGIPAYNEEANILFLLNSILAQKQQNFNIMEILVVSDGSTDRTIKLVKSLKNKKIKTFNDLKRLGKGSRINQLIKPHDNFYSLWQALININQLYCSKTYPSKWFSVETIAHLEGFQ